MVDRPAAERRRRHERGRSPDPDAAVVEPPLLDLGQCQRLAERHDGLEGDPGECRQCEVVPGGGGGAEGGKIGRAHVELQSLMRISYAVFCLKKKKQIKNILHVNIRTSEK